MGKFFTAIIILAVFLSTITQAATYGGGSGTAADPYLISTPEQLNMIGANSGDWGKCFKLANDIDMSAYTGTQYKIIGPNPNAPFHGTFDGQGHVIRNLSYSKTTPGDGFVGLFGYTSNSTIRNVGLENVNINAMGNYVGGLVGQQYSGTITNCFSTGSVINTYPAYSAYTGGLVGGNSGTITSCYSTSNVSGFSGVGGLAGGNAGTISLCYATGTVTGSTEPGSGDNIGGLVGYHVMGTITSCYATGTVTGRTHVGGLAGDGYNNGTITSCYATGTVNGTSDVGGLVGSGVMITSCYATGAVSGTNYIGGLMGSGGAITSCYATGNVTAAGNYAGGLVGRSINTITRCYATGTVTVTGDYAGGLVGLNNSTITLCYAAGDVSGNSRIGGLVGDSGTISSCYASGAVSGASFVGGICGISSGTAITTCFWDMETSQTSDGVGNIAPDPNGVIGKTTLEMQTLSTFTDVGWDFVGETANGTNDIWWMRCEGMNYPRLSWQPLSAGDLTCPDGVNNEDFNSFAQQWLLTTCTADNNYCGGADLNYSGGVTLADLSILAANWMRQ
jgi:hypothetical protein